MRSPSPIRLTDHQLTLESTKLSEKITDKKAYQLQLAQLQIEMLNLQQHCYHQKKRVIIVLEGWDASGKGGLIKRLTAKLDPRGYRVHPFGPPTAHEQGRHYLYRFYQALPVPGSIAIFDRSYYGRVLVERVNLLASTHEWQRAYQEINEFERMLADDGVCIIKLFLHISEQEQLRRFKHRLIEPTKQWKLTEDDLINREHRQEYLSALNDMFELTSTAQCPWQIIAFEDKLSGRLNALQAITQQMKNTIDLSKTISNEQFVEKARKALGLC
ncbi:polyphosphate kinase 2 family protein [Thalassotalea ganghwensis]